MEREADRIARLRRRPVRRERRAHLASTRATILTTLSLSHEDVSACERATRFEWAFRPRGSPGGSSAWTTSSSLVARARGARRPRRPSRRCRRGCPGRRRDTRPRLTGMKSEGAGYARDEVEHVLHVPRVPQPERRTSPSPRRRRARSRRARRSFRPASRRGRRRQNAHARFRSKMRCSERREGHSGRASGS